MSHRQARLEKRRRAAANWLLNLAHGKTMTCLLVLEKSLSECCCKCLTWGLLLLRDHHSAAT
jgi:hypothetical protein